MKKFSKLFLMLFIFIFAFTLVSCKGKDKYKENQGQGGNQVGGTALDPYWDADQNGIADWEEKPITLTYASWQHNNNEVETIESLMVKEFTKKYPNINDYKSLRSFT